MNIKKFSKITLFIIIYPIGVIISKLLVPNNYNILIFSMGFLCGSIYIYIMYDLQES